MPSNVLIRSLALPLLVASTQVLAQRTIHQCRDAQNRLIYQDQPCRGALHRADEPAPAQRWLSEQLGPCEMRSPAIQLPLFPWRSDAEVAAVDDGPLMISVWLELHGSRDGVALRIRGFDPLPDSGMSFDTDITGQGIRPPSGQLIAIDSLDGPGSLRYGYRGSAILLAALPGASQATLEVRVRGFQSVTANFGTAPILEAVERLRDCQDPARKRGNGQRRLPGR